MDPFHRGFRNDNSCIIGTSGGGKSTAAKVEILRGLGRGIEYVVIDPGESGAPRRASRVTSDEEERRRRGYEMKTALRFAETVHGLDLTRAVVADGQGKLAHLADAPTATLWRLNLGWNRRKDRSLYGFLLNMNCLTRRTRLTPRPAPRWCVRGRRPVALARRRAPSRL